MSATTTTGGSGGDATGSITPPSIIVVPPGGGGGIPTPGGASSAIHSQLFGSSVATSSNRPVTNTRLYSNMFKGSNNMRVVVTPIKLDDKSFSARVRQVMERDKKMVVEKPYNRTQIMKDSEEYQLEVNKLRDEISSVSGNSREAAGL